MSHIILCVLCGIPGSGKSTLCRELKSSDSPFSYIHISFDNLIGWIENQNDVPVWKQSRNKILLLVNDIIKSVQNGYAIDHKAYTSLNVNEVKQLCEETKQIVSSSSKMPIILLIDDNMFYRSMRHSFYQTAEKQNLGFCTIFLDCPYELSLARVSQRPDGHLIQNATETIASRLEKPNPLKEKWEKFSMELDSSTAFTPALLNAVEHLIKDCIDHPVQRKELPEEENKNRIATREANTANIIHQADLCLRKSVGNMSKTLRQSDINGSVCIRKLVVERKHLFQLIKSGKINLDRFVDESGKIDTDSLTTELCNRLKDAL